ncbi:MAG: sigma factor-like helix-turn-helix DNA-binding protein [Planctomycetia bacterium]|nr:sigma factor-like helix-turn-helix DNA-binding protein [Planctomycetia bacterium]
MDTHQPDNLSKPRTFEASNRSELFLKHHDFVRFVAMLNAPASDLIDDVVNDVFVAFVEGKQDWDLATDVRPLLRQITVHTAHGYWRRRNDSLPLGLAKLAEYVRSETSLWDADTKGENLEEEFSALNICLHRLPQHSRELLVEHYVQGVPIVEIAQRTSRKPSVLYNLISRARATVGRCIEGLLRRLHHGK